MANLLELTTLVSEQPSTITIDDKKYPLVSPDMLDYGASNMIKHAQRFLVDFEAKGDLMPAAEYDKASGVVVRVLLKITEIPREILDSLTIKQKAKIIDVWGTHMKSGVEKEADPLSENSEKSSQSSADSTEEPPKDG